MAGSYYEFWDLYTKLQSIITYNLIPDNFLDTIFDNWVKSNKFLEKT